MNSQIMNELARQNQTGQEERITTGILLAMAIGVLNACTWLERGHVFASSQSGNLLYLGLEISQGHFDDLMKYIFPVLMFAAGILAAEHFRDRRKSAHWRLIPYGMEVLLIAFASFLPLSWSALANPIFGLCCGLQSVTFRHIRETPVQTVFINGSFQNALIHFMRWVHLENWQDAFRAVLYSCIVSAYFGGILLGGLLSHVMGQYVSLLSCFLLVAAGIRFPKKDADDPAQASLKDTEADKTEEKTEGKTEEASVSGKEDKAA